ARARTPPSPRIRPRRFSMRTWRRSRWSSPAGAGGTPRRCAGSLPPRLVGWGSRHAATLRWLVPPPAAQLASARDLLTRLGALDVQGSISAHGREMARLPLHPRLAHLLLNARALKRVPLAAQLAALLSERDLLSAATGARDADIR